jgi:hypothetical protein
MIPKALTLGRIHDLPMIYRQFPVCCGDIKMGNYGSAIKELVDAVD